MSVVFEGQFPVHYGQAYVFSGEEGDTGQMDECFRRQSNGLVGGPAPPAPDRVVRQTSETAAYWHNWAAEL